MSEILEPITHKELFLAAAGGQQIDLPEPITREEIFLNAIAQGGGGGGGKDAILKCTGDTLVGGIWSVVAGGTESVLAKLDAGEFVDIVVMMHTPANTQFMIPAAEYTYHLNYITSDGDDVLIGVQESPDNYGTLTWSSDNTIIYEAS